VAQNDLKCHLTLSGVHATGYMPDLRLPIQPFAKFYCLVTESRVRWRLEWAFYRSCVTWQHTMASIDIVVQGGIKKVIHYYQSSLNRINTRHYG